ncbi:MAG: cache domain-containing protein, partial [Casimicrobiaceae bacterium]
MAPQHRLAASASGAVGSPPGSGAMPFRAGIRLRLVLLVLALGLPFLVYVGLSAMRQSAADRSEARERMVSLARLVAARVDDYVSDMEGAIALSSHGTVVDPAQSAANDAFLQGLRRDLPASMSNIGVWTLDGQNAGALDRLRRGDELNIADRPYFAAALAHRGLTIDGPLPARSDGEPIAIFARPLLDAAGSPRGIVTASARLSGLAGRLDVKGVAPAPTIVTLVNGEGIIVARNRDSARWIGRRFAEATDTPAARQLAEGADLGRGADGALRLTAYA